jgi:hypothetical protein
MIEVDNLRSNLHMSIYMKWPPPVESDVKHHSHHHPPQKKPTSPPKKNQNSGAIILHPWSILRQNLQGLYLP